MSSDKSFHFPAIWLLLRVGERYKPIDTVCGAAEFLLYEWPPTAGKAYLHALQVCLSALQESGPVDAVPEALMRAADEAFICYLSVVGGGTRPHQRTSRMSRAQYTFPNEPLIAGCLRSRP